MIICSVVRLKRFFFSLHYWRWEASHCVWSH